MWDRSQPQSSCRQVFVQAGTGLCSCTHLAGPEPESSVRLASGCSQPVDGPHWSCTQAPWRTGQGGRMSHLC